MINSDLLIKYHAGILCDSLHRNINDNFVSVSFEILRDGTIKIKIVLKSKTNIEIEYINDISAEFEAVQGIDNLSEVEIVVDKYALPLVHIVYSTALDYFPARREYRQ